MDPCPFVRLLVGNLLLKLPASSLPSGARGVHPFNDTPCFCKIRLRAADDRSGFRCQSQTAAVPLLAAPAAAHDSDPAPSSSGASGSASSPHVAAAFDLGPSDLAAWAAARKNKGGKKPQLSLTVEIYAGRRRASCFGFLRSGKLLGTVSVPLDLRGAEQRSAVYHSGWVSLGGQPKEAAGKRPEVHLTVRSDPDPRFVFEFGAEPQCSPQVFQTRPGGIRQPVFTCKFSRRTTSPGGAVQFAYYRPFGAASGATLDSDLHPSCSTSWLGSSDGERRRHRRNPSADRKGWSVTVHDLSGSPVALASMITPFVPSPGTDRVSRSNPGAWLVLRPGDGTWKPWGRLEAWRERGSGDGLGCRLHLIPDANTTTTNSITSSAPVVIAETTISARKGGKFAVDLATASAAVANSSNHLGALPANCSQPRGSRSRPRSAAATPGCSPRGSGDLSGALWPWNAYRGFVMSSTVEREGKSGRPGVEIGAHNVACTEDAALFVALAAAVDLSMDACTLFSRKLDKDLEPNQIY